MRAGASSVIVRRTGNEGVVAGLLGCLFGILGIFTLGIIFVPLAALCALFGLLRGVSGPSGAGIGCSLLAGVLTVWGFVVSPSLWVLVGAGILAQHAASSAQDNAAQTPAVQTPAVIAPAPRQHASRLPAPSDETQAFALLGQVQAANDRMTKFNGAMERALTRISGVEDHYRRITAKMRGFLAREQRLVGIDDYRAGAARSQISITISQGTIAAAQLHFQAQSWERYFEIQVAPLRNVIFALQQNCHWVSRSGRHALPQTYDRLQDACRENGELKPIFLYNYDKLSRSLTQLETVFKEEYKKQQQIEQISSNIE